MVRRWHRVIIAIVLMFTFLGCQKTIPVYTLDNNTSTKKDDIYVIVMPEHVNSTEYVDVYTVEGRVEIQFPSKELLFVESETKY